MVEGLVIFILALLCLATGLFLVGQYNGIVRIRRSIVAEALQLDLSIRKELHLLNQNLGNIPEKNRIDVFKKLLAIEALSHQGASNPLSGERGIMILLDAKRRLEQVKVDLVAGGGCAELDEREKRCRFLIGSYQGKFESFPSGALCCLFGFAYLKIV
jgi:hypothetical protein